jgi:CHAD domain-containing protein
VKQTAALWRLRARGLEEARQSVGRGNAEGLHDLRVALRRVATTAAALGRRRVARRAKRIARSLSPLRQLEVDRRLLERVGRLGLLSPDAVTALAARWEKLAGRAAHKLTRATDGKKMRRLRGRLARLGHKGSGSGIRRLSAARRKAEAALVASLEGQDDATLHRYRLAVKKARDLAEDLVGLGLPEEAGAARERALQESLGRWNDLRTFRKRVAEERDESQRRGSVTLAGELERLLAALDIAGTSARAAAVAASGQGARVVSMRPARARA